MVISTSFRWLVRALLVLMVAMLLYQVWIFGHVWWWVGHNPGTSSFMEQRLELLQEKNPDARLRHRWIEYANISSHLKRAIVAAEDAKFVDHEGFDWDGIKRAIEKNQRRGRIVAGGSTITQQLAKNLFLSPAKNPLRKLEEAAITLMLEAMMEKRRILELYMNVVEWGNGVFGAEAAARHYFGLPASALNADQAARLAAMLPNPRFYDRNRSAAGLLRRTQVIRTRMSQSEVP